MRLPNNRLIVGGVDLSTRFGIIMTDDYTLSPPEVIESYVDIPGRQEGPLDLTDAVTGEPSYGIREQEFVFAIIDSKDFEATKREVSNFLHGRKFDYELSFDPGYTYTGRFAIDEYYSQFRVGYIKVVVKAEPFKRKDTVIYRMNGAGGGVYEFESGRMPVRPVLQSDNAATITFDGVTSIVPAGTHRLNDVLFTEGANRIYVKTTEFLVVTWADIAQGGEYATKWSKNTTWDDLHKQTGQQPAPDYCYITYEWKDL